MQRCIICGCDTYPLYDEICSELCASLLAMRQESYEWEPEDVDA